MFGENVAIIGAGGIGSYFCCFLNKALSTNQFGDMSVENFTVFDSKFVNDQNCLHQDFTRKHEMGHPKAAVMASRYGYKAMLRKFEEADLNNYHSFIICADNRYVRNLIYKHCQSVSKMFLDMRCRADMYSLYTDMAEDIDLDASLGENPEDTTEYSCMTDEDRAAQSLMMGNSAVAVAGIQSLLNRFRAKAFPYKTELASVV